MICIVQTEQKQIIAKAALDYIRPHLNKNMVIGVGTGSTANCFIDQLASAKHLFDGAVASSEATAERLQKYGIPVYDLNSVNHLPFYIDGADEATEHCHLIKGGGAALTREKIVAAVADKFICIADGSKLVKRLGTFPLPVEVIPMARSYVARELVKIGASPEYRQGVITDNGNIILDLWHLDITDPVNLEEKINQITGVVTNGLFACRPADLLMLSDDNQVKSYHAGQVC